MREPLAEGEHQSRLQALTEQNATLRAELERLRAARP